jgi:hypothetical protein
MTDAQPQKSYVRFSNENDHEKLMAFYGRNPHDHVFDRQSDIMQKLADDGSVVLVESEKGEIVGASISYPLFAPENGVEQHKWTEIGTTRMVLNGYPGLFDVLIGMQVMRAYLVEPPEERFVCQMKSAAVQGMAQRMGFRPFVPSEEIVKVSDDTLVPDGAGVNSGFENWYALGREAFPTLARLMSDTLDKPYIENKKTGEKINLDFSRSKFFQMFEPELRDLAQRDLGDVNNPDPKGHTAKSRRDWMKHYFK